MEQCFISIVYLNAGLELAVQLQLCLYNINILFWIVYTVTWFIGPNFEKTGFFGGRGFASIKPYPGQ